jgi:hypothetical protein
MWRVFPPFVLLAIGYGAYLYFGSVKGAPVGAIMIAMLISAVVGFAIGKSLG